VQQRLLSPFLRRRTSVTLLSVGTIALFLAAMAVRANQDLRLDRDDWQDRDDNRLGGIHKIKHVIIIMQENRSFDSYLYFGTFPGA
jgi:phospholipase C